VSHEYDSEPVRGLPGHLPKGEHIVWQGAPEWRRLARDAFKTRWLASYFAALIVWALVDGSTTGVAMTLGVAATGLGLLHLLAWLVARATVYTVTNRRVVLRFGVALTKCINLPMNAIAGAGLKRNADGSGDVPLQLSGAHRLGYAQFWPHARPWKLGRPEPMLRSIADVDAVAAMLTDALVAANPAGRRVSADATQTEPTGALATA
jgi:hypothetical protein